MRKRKIQELAEDAHNRIITKQTDGYETTVQEIGPSSSNSQSRSRDACYWAISDIRAKLHSIETTLRTVQRIITKWQ